jgi:hypothetical protein
LSLFPSAGKVTKRAAAADKRLKINSHSAQENKLGRRNRPQTYFLIRIHKAGKACNELIFLTPFLRGGLRYFMGADPLLYV